VHEELEALDRVGGRKRRLADVDEVRERARVLGAFGIAVAGCRLAFASGRRRQPESLGDLPVDPWARRGRASDHDAVATGLAQQRDRVSCRLDVTVADDRNPHRVAHTGDVLPARVAATSLRGDARMNGEPRGAGRFQHACEIEKVLGIVREPRPELDGDRPRRVLDGEPDDLLRVGRVTHQRHTPVVLQRLADRTAHVDVDRCGTHALQLAERGGDEALLVRQQLGDQRLVVREGGLGPIADALGRQPARRQHLGEQERRVAVRKIGRHRLPQGRVRQPDHRRQEAGKVDGEAARAERVPALRRHEGASAVGRRAVAAAG
jgi:hypothetical protein